MRLLRMGIRDSAVGVLLAGATLIVATGPVAAAQPVAVGRPDPGSKAQVYTQKVALSQAECQAMADADPVHASSILNHCYATVTLTLSPLVKAAQSPASQLQAMAASGCTWGGTATADWTWQSFPAYWVKVRAKYEVNSCNEVKWNWVTCDSSWVWPWSISITYCGAYPNTGRWTYYTGTNVGINYTVSTIISGSTHGGRWGIRPIPYGFYGVFEW